MANAPPNAPVHVGAGQTSTSLAQPSTWPTWLKWLVGLVAVGLGVGAYLMLSRKPGRKKKSAGREAGEAKYPRLVYPAVGTVAAAVRKYPGDRMMLSVYPAMPGGKSDWSLDVGTGRGGRRAPDEMTVAQSRTFARKLIADARKRRH